MPAVRVSTVTGDVRLAVENLDCRLGELDISEETMQEVGRLVQYVYEELDGVDRDCVCVDDYAEELADAQWRGEQWRQLLVEIERELSPKNLDTLPVLQKIRKELLLASLRGEQV